VLVGAIGLLRFRKLSKLRTSLTSKPDFAVGAVLSTTMTPARRSNFRILACQPWVSGSSEVFPIVSVPRYTWGPTFQCHFLSHRCAYADNFHYMRQKGTPQETATLEIRR
jgi:hypothetical protein